MTDREVAQLIETGLSHHRANDLQKAEQTYRRVLEYRPGQPDALHLLGVIAHQVGQHNQAIPMIEQALKGAPRLAPAWNNYGEALRAAGRVDDGLAAYKKAFELKPDFFEAIGNAARTLDDLKRFTESIDLWQRYLRLQPKDINAYHALATALFSTNQEPQAVACWQKLLSLDPAFYRAHNDVGVVLGNRMQFDQADHHFNESIRIAPQYATAYYNKGVIYERQGRAQEAIAQYSQSIELDPNAPDPQLNLSLMELMTGHLQDGFRRYEWRWKVPRVIPLIKSFPQPEWRGEDVAGKTVLIHAEQGMGDTLQFARYAKIVADKGAKVIFMVQRPLMTVLEGVEGVSQLIPDEKGLELPPFDMHIPSLTLPLICGTELGNVPAAVPYVKADPAKTAVWADRLKDDKNFRIGITWAGRPEHHNDHNRSASLQLFQPLTRVPGVSFYSIQKGSAADQKYRPPAGMHLIDCDPGIADFSDSAALLENLDLVISVDTSIIHLAGAMNRPVWALIPLVPDWRWMLDRDDSPWYPSLRMFRQTKLKDWPPVFERVAAALAEEVAKHPRRQGTVPSPDTPGEG